MQNDFLKMLKVFQRSSQRKEQLQKVETEWRHNLILPMRRQTLKTSIPSIR